MTCRYCASDLPVDAAFCGECGRAVVAESLVGANVLAGSREGAGDAAGETGGESSVDYARFAPPSSFVSATDVEAPDATADADAPAPPAEVEIVSSAVHCPQCDSVVDDADIFCGECGFVLKAVIPGPRDADTADPEPEPAAWPFTGDQTPAAPLPPESAPQPRKDPIMDTENHDDELASAGRSRTIPDPFPWGAADLDEDAEDIEATRLVSVNGGDRFVLQFSTGESVTVTGAGLIGRNPAAQPGEYVDQLVSIFDVGKSVSKTHLEFGQEGGRFWVSDRYSTNGSVVRQPEAEPRRCEPGRRYFVVRGTRIDVGEQFFVVS
jgi:hypothetical protein